MSLRIVKELVDDIDGGSADETVEFAIDGICYEIDLSAEHAQQMRDTVEQWVSVARRVEMRTFMVPPNASAAYARRRYAKQVREWAKQQGYNISQRGRIPAHVIKDYDRSNKVNKITAK